MKVALYLDGTPTTGLCPNPPLTKETSKTLRMKKLMTTMIWLAIFQLNTVIGQDSPLDKAKLLENSTAHAHLTNLFTLHGQPLNNNNDSLWIMVNHGYALGFSPIYNQPLWAAYQVSKSTRDVDYERFPLFVDDARLSKVNQIGSATFGNGYDRGHLVPNEAINRQYGKLAQMETFLMSNIAPQRKELNQGVWMRLEKAIRETYTSKNDTNHIWVLTGPVFGATPTWLERPNGVKVAVPEAFYCILARPVRYPAESPASAQYLAFLFPQQIAQNESIRSKYLVSIDQIEARTGLNFFPHFTPAQQERFEKNPATTLW